VICFVDAATPVPLVLPGIRGRTGKMSADANGAASGGAGTGRRAAGLAGGGGPGRAASEGSNGRRDAISLPPRPQSNEQVGVASDFERESARERE